MSLKVIHVDEEFLECYVLKRPSRIVLLDKTEIDYPLWESVKACTCYVGRIDLERFNEMRAWVAENCTGTVIHNYPVCHGERWHTGFGFTDSRAFFAFKMTFAETHHRDDLNIH